MNTSYSCEEEGQVTSDITRIIPRRFPKHSVAFYDHEIVTLTTKLKKGPKDVEAHNDLAVALMKLERYGEAELLRIDDEQPNRYKTHTNLGVLYKNTAQFTKAAAHMSDGSYNFWPLVKFLIGGTVVLAGAIIFLLRRTKIPMAILQSGESASIS